MTLAIPIIILLFGLFLIGHFAPSYPATTKKPPTYSAPPDSKGWAVLSTMPDLRVSEFAPDWYQAVCSERYGEEQEIPNPLKGYKKPQQPNYYEIL